MCNCGSKRNSFTAQPAATAANRQPSQTLTQKMWPDVHFVYTGQSALTTTGNITGRQYRFSVPGDKQAVDYRDAPSMMKVPVLKKV